jgi:hypothetical protein
MEMVSKAYTPNHTPQERKAISKAYKTKKSKIPSDPSYVEALAVANTRNAVKR